MNNYLFDLLNFLIGLLLLKIFLNPLIKLLGKSSLTDINYRGEKIPTSLGLAFIFGQILTLGLTMPFNNGSAIGLLTYLIGFTFIGLLGLLDDSIGTDEFKGFKGHIKAFFEGTLTTGNIKASLGFFISLFVSYRYSLNFYTFLLNGLLIALFVNLLNLFDLRPGRAGKVFFVLGLILMTMNKSSDYNYLLFSLYGILIPYMIKDLKALVMMGDTGSNILGFTLGFYSMVNFNVVVKLIILLILIFIHIFAEKYSITKFIENNRVLNFLDRLGR